MPVPIIPSKSLPRRITLAQESQANTVELEPPSTILQYFPEAPTDGQIHVIVELPTSSGEWGVLTLLPNLADKMIFSDEAHRRKRRRKSE